MPRSPSAKAAFPEWRATSLSRRAEVMFQMRELVDANRKEIASLLTAEHGKVLERRARRGRPRPREHRVRLRHPAPAEGRLQRAGRDRRRRVHRSASRSASSPASRRSTSRRWCRCGCSPTPSRAATRSCSSRARRTRRRRMFIAELLAAGRAARRVLQRRAGRQGGRRPPARAPRHRRGELRRLDADRQVHLRDRHRATASGCRRSAGPRTTCSCCPTPTSTWPPTPPSAPAYGSAGERCMAISVVLAVDIDRRRRWSPRSPSASRRSRSARPASRTTRWAR